MCLADPPRSERSPCHHILERTQSRGCGGSRRKLKSAGTGRKDPGHWAACVRTRTSIFIVVKTKGMRDKDRSRRVLTSPF